MSSRLDRIEARAKQVIDRADNEPGWTPAGHFSAPAVLALVNVAKAAEEAANPMTPDGPAAPFMWLPANEKLREALAVLDKAGGK